MHACFTCQVYETEACSDHTVLLYSSYLYVFDHYTYRTVDTSYIIWIHAANWGRRERSKWRKETMELSSQTLLKWLWGMQLTHTLASIFKTRISSSQYKQQRKSSFPVCAAPDWTDCSVSAAHWSQMAVILVERVPLSASLQGWKENRLSSLPWI